MGITEEYREDVEVVEHELQDLVSRKRAWRAKNILDKLLPLAILSILAIILFGFGLKVNSSIASIITYLNWAVIAYFAARLAVGLRLAKSNKRFFKTHWMDFVLVIPAFSLLEEAEMLEFMADTGWGPVQDETIASSMLASRNAGVFAKMTRIVRIVKKIVIG